MHTTNKAPGIGSVIPPIWQRTPSDRLVDLLVDLGERVLVGPGRDLGEHAIDDAFATPFAVVLEDLRSSLGLQTGGPLPHSIGTPIARYFDDLWTCPEVCEFPRDEIRIQEVIGVDCEFAGVAALQLRSCGELARPLGLFVGARLAVEASCQGLGIGRALVMARLILDERLAVWSHDKPGYSQAGAMTVLSAARELCRPNPTAKPELMLEP